MRQWLRLFAFTLVVGLSQVVAWAQTPATATATLADKHVLVLISSGYGYRGVETYMTELLTKLQQGGLLLSNIHTEYLQMENQVTPEERRRLADFLSAKYRKFNIELVYCVQQAALNFLLSDVPELAPNAPVLTVNSELQPGVNPGQRQLVFQARKFDVQGTMRQALALFPDTQRVIVLFGNSNYDLLRQQSIQADLAPWQNKLAIENTQALSAEEIEARLANVPKNTIVLGAGIAQDAQGHKFVPDVFARRVAQVSKAPVFTFFDSYMGFGAIGGRVVSIRQEASDLGGLGINLLRGATRLDGLITNLPLRYVAMFDWQQLERWGANKDALPPDAVFVNQPVTLWSQYQYEVIAAVLALALLSILSARLWLLNRHLAHAKDAVSLSEARFRALVEQAPEAIIVYDLDLKCIVDANARAQSLFGCDRETLLAGGPQRFYAQNQPDDVDVIHSISEHSERALAGEEVRFERIVRRADHQDRRCDVWVVALPHAERRLVRASFVDITERHRVELALQSSIREKVALLNEVHHRVNNNLQVITSLLRLEAARTGHTETKGVLTEMQGRIRSMALLHESLYRSGIFAAVDLGTYLKQLVTQAFRSQISPNSAIGLEMDLDPIMVGMDQATPCGLLVNELVVNCLKHGFPSGHSGIVRIELKPVVNRQDGTRQVRLCVSDTGIGLGPDFDIKRIKSLGLQLASDLSRQLGGTLQFEPGKTFSVTFTVNEPIQSVAVDPEPVQGRRAH